MREQLKNKVKALEKLHGEIDVLYEDYIKELLKKQANIQQGINYMIMPIGLHYEIACMTLALTKPQNVLFLYTEASHGSLEKVIEAMHYKEGQYVAVQVDDADPLQVYKAINVQYEGWGKPSGIYMDISGGTKVMSVATAWAGITLDAKFLYINSNDFIKEINKPAIGEEELVVLEDPISFYGDHDIEMAYEHMEAYDYVSASEIFKQLMTKTTDIKRHKDLKILYHLSSGYEHWDNLEFKEGYKDFARLIEYMEGQISKHGHCILSNQLKSLQHQKVLLKRLGYEFENKVNYEIVRDLDSVMALVMTIYRSAMRRKKQEKYDMAVLLLYRLLEIISQRRLAVNKINYEDPCFTEYFSEVDYVDFKLSFNKLKNRVFDDHRTYKPPRRHITLIDGYFILATVDDSLLRNYKNIPFLKELYGYCKVRNQSVFAHGYKVIGEEEFNGIHQFVKGLLYKFCTLEKIDMAGYQETVAFIHPHES